MEEEVPDGVVKDLTCPLCGGLFRDAYTISECLHTCLLSLSILTVLFSFSLTSISFV